MTATGTPLAQGDTHAGAPSETSDQAFEERLERLLDMFETRKSAAEIAGKSVDQLQAYLKGRSAVPLRPIARLCAAQGISLDWLVSGQPGPGATSAAGGRRGESKGGEPEPAEITGRGDGTVLVPPYDAGLYHGRLGKRSGVDWIALPIDLVERVLRRQPEHLASLIAAGDAMSPTINDGDLVVVDIGDRKLADGCLYALQTDRQPVLRRVARQASGGVRLLAERGGFIDELVPAAETCHLAVIGRIVWAGSAR